jgi:Rrf2 family nitric oxide-sensitive transcriptional repressor
MKWNKSTRFALYAALEMAQKNGAEDGDDLINIPATAEKYKISAHHLAKVMQTLVRADIATSVRGTGGGYRLARSPKSITLMDVVEIFEGKINLDRCVLQERLDVCESLGSCRLKQVFAEIEQQAYFTLKSISLATLANQ